MSISEWLHLHDLNSETVFDCISVIEGDHLQLELDGRLADHNDLVGPGVAALDSVVSTAIIPALAAALRIEASMMAELVHLIRWDNIPYGEPPQTIDHGAGQPPEIRIAWQGSISDLICLAHEVAHAVQLQLSVGAFMPPVARESLSII